jgi:hypothetical protein
MGSQGLKENSGNRGEGRGMRKFYFQKCVVFRFCLFISSGCGYSARSALSSSLKTIHVELFDNQVDFTSEGQRNVYLPLLEVKVRNAIVDRFQFDGNLKIAKGDNADLVLKGSLTSYERDALRYTDADDVEEYRVRVVVSLVLLKSGQEEPRWTEPSFGGEATYFVTGASATSEDSAVVEAMEDLARRIVERTIEDW